MNIVRFGVSACLRRGSKLHLFYRLAKPSTGRANDSHFEISKFLVLIASVASKRFLYLYGRVCYFVCVDIFVSATSVIALSFDSDDNPLTAHLSSLDLV